MKYFDICTKREYEKDGEKKANWLKCGKMRVSDDGKQFIELFMFPTTSFYVFEQKPKNDAPTQEAGKTIKPEDIKWEE